MHKTNANSTAVQNYTSAIDVAPPILVDAVWENLVT